jgi:DNA-binding transcriptional MerR regulator
MSTRDDTADDTMTIGEMCAEFDVTPRTLRFYEAKELLNPIRDGQKRLFTSRDRARLKLILRGKRFGFSLSEIHKLLDLYNPADGQMRQLTATLDHASARLEAMRSQRAELDVAIADLESQIDLVRRLLSERAHRAAAE